MSTSAIRCCAAVVTAFIWKGCTHDWDVTPSGQTDAADHLDASSDADPESVNDDGGGHMTLDGTPLPPLEEACETSADRGGLFAASNGDDSGECGFDRPCRSLARALQRAELGAKNIYLSAGTFVGGVSLGAGVRISGGWASDWTRDCAAPARTVITGRDGSDFVVAATGINGTAVLDRLSLQSEDPATVGEAQSVYGLLATGESTVVLLERVEITTSNAGHGAAGRSGQRGGARTGTCTPEGTGSNGEPGRDASPAVGTFTAGGYLPGNGKDGASGSPGSNGSRTLAMPGTAPSYSCSSPCGTPFSRTLEKGTDGLPGCGGSGGEGGRLGGGGGSSIAIYVWDATVRASAGRFSAGNGGNGGDGGGGGLPGDGAPGLDGQPGPIEVVETSCCGTPMSLSAPGGKGFPGGSGGRGGSASGGSGGYSYAVYTGGVGRAEVAQSSLQFGAAGRGGGGPVAGPSGDAAARNQ